MNWNDLEIVLAVAREGTLLGAARPLGVSHTTVGRRLKSLEEELGVRLFDRTPAGLMPTPAGEDLADVAERVEGEILSAEGRVLGRDAKLRGNLRVSTADVLFYGFEDVFASFTQRYPSVELTVLTSNQPVSLTRREADVVLRMSSSPTDFLVGRKVGRVQFAVYASRALVERVGDQASLSDYPWIGWDSRKDWQWFEKWLDEHAPGAEIVQRMSNNMVLMTRVIRAGRGVQVLPCFIGDRHADLVRMAPLDQVWGLDLWLLTLPDLRKNSRCRAFIRHMASELEGHRDAPGASTHNSGKTPMTASSCNNTGTDVLTCFIALQMA